tara:strand:- start:249 stop:1004 length:756 start_codon:yes stop_codon:yes gene_type:complete
MDNSSLKPNILVTGGTSRFCKYLKKELKNFKAIFPTKRKFDITNFSMMKKFIKKRGIDIIIHIAALSRPMSIHDEFPEKSIDTNIIGTCNIAKLASQFGIKLIFFSSQYVYPGKRGNYKESDPLLPFNNYAWSKLGAECAVKLCKNSLILRMCMTEFPFVHKKAIKGAKTSFLFNNDVAKFIPYLLNETGVINVGGKRRDIYDFAKRFKKNIAYIKLNELKNYAKDSSLDNSKLIKILKKKNFNFKQIKLL